MLVMIITEFNVSYIQVTNGMEHQMPSIKPLNVRVKPYILMSKYVFQLNLKVSSEKPDTNYANLTNLYLYCYPLILISTLNLEKK